MPKYLKMRFIKKKLFHFKNFLCCLLTSSRSEISWIIEIMDKCDDILCIHAQENKFKNVSLHCYGTCTACLFCQLLIL